MLGGAAITKVGDEDLRIFRIIVYLFIHQQKQRINSWEKQYKILQKRHGSSSNHLFSLYQQHLSVARFNISGIIKQNLLKRQLLVASNI